MFLSIKSPVCAMKRALSCSAHACGTMASVLIALAVLSSCSPRKEKGREFFSFDSLVNSQVSILKHRQLELNKRVDMNGKSEETRFTPDSTQWSNELEIFRLLDALNKASFRDGYVVTEMRDTNSNLNVREIRSQVPAPVSEVKFYYLKTPNDLRKIEATWLEENTLYTNTRRMVIEFEPVDNQNLLHRYRIEGFQKMVLDDSVKFLIAAEVSI